MWIVSANPALQSVTRDGNCVGVVPAEEPFMSASL